MESVIGVALDFVPDVNATMSRGIPNQTIVATTKPTMDAFKDAGAIVIGLGEARSINEASNICQMIDALIVPGGPDIYPGTFNNRISRYNGTICPLKDDSDVLYIKAMYKLKKPILGICRGMQLMNLLKGGTLVEDIPHCTDSKIVHFSPVAPEWLRIHDIEIASDSFLSNIYKASKLSVNSFHHQSVLKLGEGFRCTSKSDDGIVESIEDLSGKWIGLQWHPEYLYQKYPEYLDVFKQFLKIVKAPKSK